MASDQFVAEVRLFPCTFAPAGWATCEGQLLPISQNTALFSLLGTQYGGDGKSNFALPDLSGRVPLHQNHTNPALPDCDVGQAGGSRTVTLLESEIPAHAHQQRASLDPADETVPSASASLARSSGGALYRTAAGGLMPLAPETLQPAGGGLPHNNMQPYLAMRFCIALQGIFPMRP